jgi:bifunctional UDP-N-acetylglucosamine pyrophosphorylase / glucosamine-1-phosphate N-acetyltransferase
MGEAPTRPRASVILAAGKGERMKSPTPKVMHLVGGRTMVDRAIDVAEALGCERIVVVVGPHAPAVRAHVAARLGEAAIAVQDRPLGTGHAVLAAKERLAGFAGDVLVTYADVPLLTAQVVEPLFDLRDDGADIAVLGFEPLDARAYGRLVMGGGDVLERIVEAAEATAGELAIRTCNSGVLAAPAPLLFDLLSQVRADNAKGEYYLTDVVGLACEAGRPVRVALAAEETVAGVDSQSMLAAAEAAFQRGRRDELMAAGVTLVAPETVFLAWDTAIAGGVRIEPNVVIGPGVAIEAGVVIGAFSHLEGALVRAGARIGPFARLRPGAEIGQDAHIGNFVEVKKVQVGAGAKANHLAYLGDGTVGAGANIGAGTIFCNYDGFDKFDTHVGEGAFIGSNSALVAPVSIGAGAYVGSGSVIIRDVGAGALALGRGPQVEKPGWAAVFRTRKRREKGG